MADALDRRSGIEGRSADLRSLCGEVPAGPSRSRARQRRRKTEKDRNDRGAQLGVEGGGTRHDIEPVLKQSGDDLQQRAVIANVRYNAQRLQHAKPILAEMIARNEVRVVGAVCDLATGKVTLV
jgi:carbonic anhydrase